MHSYRKGFDQNSHPIREPVQDRMSLAGVCEQVFTRLGKQMARTRNVEANHAVRRMVSVCRSKGLTI